METLKEFGLFLAIVFLAKILDALINPYTLRFLKCLDCGNRIGKEAAQVARKRYERQKLMRPSRPPMSARRSGRPMSAGRLKSRRRPQSYPVTCFTCGAENDFLPEEGKWRNQPEKEPVIWSAISRWLKRRSGGTPGGPSGMRRA